MSMNRTLRLCKLTLTRTFRFSVDTVHNFEVVSWLFPGLSGCQLALALPRTSRLCQLALFRTLKLSVGLILHWTLRLSFGFKPEFDVVSVDFTTGL